MNIIIYESSDVEFLHPFTINHASFELKVGVCTNFDRIKLIFPNDDIYLIVRKEIEDLIKEKYPKTSVNPENVPAGLCLNGSVIWEKKHLEILNNNISGYNRNKLYFLYTKIKYSLDDISKLISNFNSGIPLNEEVFRNVQYLWDLFKYNKQILSSDVELYKFNAISLFPSVAKLFDTIDKKHDLALLVNEKNIIINEDSKLKTGVILDATEGPIIIGKNVIIDIGALIQGPVFIDDNSYIAPGAKIRSETFIGKNCKVGGEVSCSVISNYSNKIHDGFLGHSFIGEWVNIGAGTNNSNLKNNYGIVKFDFGNNQGPIDTGEQFLGALIGDYTRIGISSMLNTGTHIGLGSNVFGGGFQDKYIPSFSWGKKDKVNFNKFIETCKVMKKRRGVEILYEEINFLKKLYNKSS